MLYLIILQLNFYTFIKKSFVTVCYTLSFGSSKFSEVYYHTILLASYLFLTLIAVVKITNIFMGPSREMN